MKRRREDRTITILKDEENIQHTTSSGIARTMTTYLQKKYEERTVDASSIQRLPEEIQTSNTPEDSNGIENPFKPEEIYDAFRVGKRKRAPGIDGLGREFYLQTWDIIKDDMCDINQMFFEHATTPKQKHGVIICLPKKRGGTDPKKLPPYNTPKY